MSSVKYFFKKNEYFKISVRYSVQIVMEIEKENYFSTNHLMITINDKLTELEWLIFCETLQLLVNILMFHSVISVIVLTRYSINWCKDLKRWFSRKSQVWLYISFQLKLLSNDRHFDQVIVVVVVWCVPVILT